MRETLFNPFIIFATGFLTVFFISISGAEEPIRGLTIDQAVGIALHENRDLMAARMEIEEARGRLTQAGLFPNPVLDSNFSSDFAFGNEGERSFSAGISQPIPLSGRIGAQRRAARVDIKRTFADLANKERRLVRDVRRNFIEVLAIDEQIKLQDTLIDLNSDLVEAIKVGIKEGLASQKDLNAVAIALQQARQEREVLISQRSSNILELDRLLGKPPTFSFLPEGNLEYRFPEHLAEYNAQTAFAKRPDLKFAELDAELAKANLGLAKALRFEDITVGISYQRDRTILDIPEGSIPNTDNLIGFKLTVPLPFFDRNQGRIAEARAREIRAEESIEALKLEISQEVNDALNRVNALAAILGTYESGILKAAEDNVKLVESGYRQGLAGITEVIQSRQQFANLKSSYINAIRDYQIALNDLQISTGTYPSTINFNETGEGENK